MERRCLGRLEAELQARRALELRAEVAAPEVPLGRTQLVLAWVLLRREQHAESAFHAGDVARARLRTYGPRDPRTQEAQGYYQTALARVRVPDPPR